MLGPPPPPPPAYDHTDCADHPELGWCRGEADLLDSRNARAELVRAAVLDALAFHCAECHSSLAPPPGRYEPLAIDDLDALVRDGQIVPLNSAASPLLARSQSGEMPPPGSARPPLAQADLDMLALFIDSPSFWPQASPSDCDAAARFSDFDLVFQSVAADLATLPSTELAFYRYLSLTNRANTACSEAELEGDRRALRKGLNMLSLSPSVQAPIAIDDTRRIYRIDLRDFDWTRSLERNGNRFGDVWEAIAAESPYSVEFTGDAASLAKTATGTAFPMLFADHLLDQALSGELYYAIVGVRPGEALYDFEVRALGVDAPQALDSGLVQRAGTSRSRVTGYDRGVQRYELTAGGVFWQSIDHTSSAYGIFEDPLEGWWNPAQDIFSLPNGLFAFVGSDPNDLFVSGTGVRFDTLDYPLPAGTGVSCSACHASGLIPVVDEIKPVALRNAREIGLDAAELERIEQVYPEPSSFLQTLASDSARYQQALSQLQLPITGADPVASASLRFGAPLTLRDAAGELGLRPEALAARLSRVAPRLSALESGTLGRDAFGAVYVASLCVLSEPLANRPDAAACERALARSP